VIVVRVLRQGRKIEEVPTSDLTALRTEPGILVWVDVSSPTPDELASLGREFGLHEVALEDLEIDERQRPKEVDLVAGQNYLLSVHGGTPVDPGAMVRRVKDRPELASEGAGYLLYVALDELVDTFFPALDALGERVVEVEQAILGGDVDAEGQIFAIRKELIAFRRVVGPMPDATVVLLRRDLGVVSREAQRYLQDVYDHLIRLSETIEDYQDVLAGTLDVNATMASNRVNTVARNLAAYAAIFAVVTMISGIYGMNFDHMPELGWQFGYGWALGLMAVCAGGLWVYFKRKGWL
jgi:magnesium transporter